MRVMTCHHQFISIMAATVTTFKSAFLKIFKRGFTILRLASTQCHTADHLETKYCLNKYIYSDPDLARGDYSTTDIAGWDAAPPQESHPGSVGSSPVPAKRKSGSNLSSLVTITSGCKVVTMLLTNYNGGLNCQY